MYDYDIRDDLLSGVANFTEVLMKASQRARGMYTLTLCIICLYKITC